MMLSKKRVAAAMAASVVALPWAEATMAGALLTIAGAPLLVPSAAAGGLAVAGYAVAYVGRLREILKIREAYRLADELQDAGLAAFLEGEEGDGDG